MRKLFFILLFYGLSNLQAQETLPASGGEASGSGGSATYTIGQVFYTTKDGTNGNSIAEGVQQPYEISVVTETPEAKNICLSILAYPNPTTEFIILKTKNYEFSKLSFQLFDINGKLLQTIKAKGQETKINTIDLASANYFVKVFNDNKEIKVFKIIKK